MMVLLARVARTGVQDYGDHYEYRPANEVFDDASMATYPGTPVVVGHKWVDEDNVNELAVGYVRSAWRDRGDGIDEYVGAEVVITDAATAEEIRAGRLAEFSMGYSVALEPKPGQTSDGEKYDAVQTEIRINHAALGPRNWARCGSACSFT